jgi:hypothetical protein
MALGMTLHRLWLPIDQGASTAALDERPVGADEGGAHAAAKSPLIGPALAGEARLSALLLQAS